MRVPVFEHWKMLELCVFRKDLRDSVSLLGDTSAERLPALPGNANGSILICSPLLDSPIDMVTCDWYRKRSLHTCQLRVWGCELSCLLMGLAENLGHRTQDIQGTCGQE